MGVLLNQFHHLFAAVVMRSAYAGLDSFYFNIYNVVVDCRNPFLGIYDTVQDPSSPLVVHEYDEWGDTASAGEAGGREEAVMNYIRSYSPYDNVSSLVVPSLLSTGKGDPSKHKYPAVYLTLGMQDDRVDPKHAMMWTDRIRERLNCLTNEKAVYEDRIVVRVQENCGHDGPGTVEEQVEEAAMEIAFLESVVRVGHTDK